MTSQRPEEWHDQVVEQPEAVFYTTMRVWEGKIWCGFSRRLRGEARSTLAWETTVTRPPGKTLDECLEAAQYRVARAAADGSLVEGFPPPRPLT